MWKKEWCVVCGAGCGRKPVRMKGGAPLCGPCGRKHLAARRKKRFSVKGTDAMHRRLPGSYGSNQ